MGARRHGLDTVAGRIECPALFILVVRINWLRSRGALFFDLMGRGRFSPALSGPALFAPKCSRTASRSVSEIRSYVGVHCGRHSVQFDFDAVVLHRGYNEQPRKDPVFFPVRSTITPFSHVGHVVPAVIGLAKRMGCCPFVLGAIALRIFLLKSQRG